MINIMKQGLGLALPNKKVVPRGRKLSRIENV